MNTGINPVVFLIGRLLYLGDLAGIFVFGAETVPVFLGVTVLLNRSVLRELKKL